MSAIIEGIIILVVGLICAAVVIMLIEVVKDERLDRHHTCEEKGDVPLVYDGNFLCVKPESLVSVE